MTSQLALLIEACPPWFAIRSQASNLLEGLARIDAWPDQAVALTLEERMALAVRETKPGAVFPAVCHERHIQDDHTFCVGLRRALITTRRHAQAWWFHLGQFLECQVIAEATGLWPPKNALDHGVAGELHQRALEIARKLGIEDDYWEAYLGQPSWITTPGSRWAHPQDDAPKTRPRRPRVKRTQKAQRLLQELVFVERRRRRRLAEYRTTMAAYGGPCCGRMRDCPQRGGPPAEPLPA